MNTTPHANRLHIALFGRCNSGKSSLLNALTGQNVSIVSDTPGTTTDPVYKAMEVPKLGPCLFIDTPGFDDTTELGKERIKRTMDVLDKTDIALLIMTKDYDYLLEKEWMDRFKERGIPVVPVLSKFDLITEEEEDPEERFMKLCHKDPAPFSVVDGIGIEDVFLDILDRLPAGFGEQTITGDLVAEGDLVLLVMPQNIQAPKGRLILPQVQTMRELLDKKCLIMSCTTDKLAETMRALAYPPKLIITDSQVFNTVYNRKPAESKLTSFSVLFAGYKGDIDYYIEGAAAIDRLTEHSRVLIAEACTHAPQTEDIGRVKIPRLLRERIGESLSIDIVSGKDFPEYLSNYDLVIHCGACMFNRQYVLNRIKHARNTQVPMTNYGVAIAHLQGILDKISY